MSGILGIFNIGRLSLFAQQRAIAVTSQNIANVNTPGYSRQEAVLETTPPSNDQPGQIGTGVRVTEIRRLIDRFIESRVTSEQSNVGRFQVDKGTLNRVEAVFNDAQGTGINQSIAEFFAAISDLSNTPQGRSERIALLEQANTLAQQFTTVNGQLQQIQKDLNSEVSGVITDINTLSGEIADLNGQIRQVEITGQKANDLRDQRTRLLNALAEKIDINSFEDSLGQTTVMVGGGKPLVESNKAYILRGVINSDNSGFLKVVHDPGTGTTVDITTSIANGRLKGLLDLRDTTLTGYINQLDQLAGSLINEVNQQHRIGYGLDSSTGTDFFSPLAPTVSALSTNTGTASISATVATPSSLTLNPYQLSFSGGNYTIRNLTTGTTLTSATLPMTFEGIQVSLTSGAALSGDTFNISAHKGSAGAIRVASAVATTPDKIAAASSVAGLPGDNGNALLLGQLQHKTVSALGNSTFQGFYSSAVAAVGSRSQLAQRNVTAEDLIVKKLDNARDDVSGVSLDEEMTNLIKYQRAFEASARLITMTDQLLQTLLDLKR